MTWKKLYQWVLAALCALLSVLLAIAFITLYRQGAALRAVGDTSAMIFTREKLAERLAPLLPLAVLVAGLVLTGILFCVKSTDTETTAHIQGFSKMDRGLRFYSGTAEQILARERRVARARVALIVAAATLIALGIFNGGMRDVLYKAINICTECVGLG